MSNAADNTRTDTTCPCCGEDLDFSWTNTHWLLDVRVEELDAFVTMAPCCQGMADEIEAFGYEAATGRSLTAVVAEITGHDVLEITDDMDANMVCRLELIDPTQVKDDTDKHGNRKASSPKGWQGNVFNTVSRFHRHHQAPQGWKFGIAVHNGPVRVGVATVGRPVSRVLDDGTALEVTRVCTLGSSPLRYNATSKLYAAAAKRARSMGYQRLLTYTLHGIESGGSLIAAGWVPTLISDGGSWNSTTRTRTDKAPTTAKVRWEKGLNKSAKRVVSAKRIELPPVAPAAPAAPAARVEATPAAATPAAATPAATVAPVTPAAVTKDAPAATKDSRKQPATTRTNQGARATWHPPGSSPHPWRAPASQRGSGTGEPAARHQQGRSRAPPREKIRKLLTQYYRIGYAVEHNKEDIMAQRFIIHGTTDQVNECDKCGRVDLRCTVAISHADIDGNAVGDPFHTGTTCAARFTKRSKAFVESKAAAADSTTIVARLGAWRLRSKGTTVEAHNPIDGRTVTDLSTLRPGLAANMAAALAAAAARKGLAAFTGFAD